MILKKCVNGSMILIDGISEVHVYEKDGFPWVQIQRGKEQTTHRLDEPAFILNDDGKTIERLPHCKPSDMTTTLDGDKLYESVVEVSKKASRRYGVV